MDLHLPKPLHGWRTFAGEVGIIVLGVLLALVAQQIAEDIQWRGRVDAARATLGNDMGNLFGYLAERELYSRCLARRFDDIAAILDVAQRSGRLPPVGEIGNPSTRPYGLPSWDALSATGLGAHLSRDDLLSLTTIASLTARISESNRAEFDAWSRLYVIGGPGRPIGEAELGELRAALSSAGFYAKLMRISSYQIRDSVGKSSIRANAKFVREWPQLWAYRKRHVAERPICRPLGKAPDRYGHSPMQYALDGPIDG